MAVEPQAGGDELDVQVYRSRRVADMYLMVPAGDDLSEIPEALLQKFGVPEESFRFRLTPGRRLARVDPAQLRAALETQGYYLQLPPEVRVEELLKRLSDER